nr:hypothetical protein [Microbacterium sp. NIBRBAC000506063]
MRQQEPRGGVQQQEVAAGGVAPVQRVEVVHPRVGLERAAVRADIVDHGVGDRLGAAARKGPAAGVRVGGQQQSRRRGAQRGQRGVRVGDDTGEQRRGLLGPEGVLRHRRALFEHPQAEAEGGERMPRHP